MDWRPVSSIKSERSNKRMKKCLAGRLLFIVPLHSHPDQLSLRSPLRTTYARPRSLTTEGIPYLMRLSPALVELT